MPLEEWVDSVDEFITKLEGLLKQVPDRPPDPNTGPAIEFSAKRLLLSLDVVEGHALLIRRRVNELGMLMDG